MKKLLIAICFIFTTLFLQSCFAESDYEKPQQLEAKKYAFVSPKGEEIIFNLQVADEPDEHKKGLMFVKKILEKEGMIFIFNEAKLLSFWMKNTEVPLDVIFINSGNIVGIVENTEPFSLLSISPKPNLPANMVVELKSGSVKKHGINKYWKFKALN